MKKTALAIILFSSLIYAQEKNKLSVDEQSGKSILLGIYDRTAFADTSYSWWFNSEYDNYTPDSTSLMNLQKKLNDFNITIVLATWCSDSRREVPRFFKILDKLGYNEKQLTLICVDRKKTAPVENIEILEIKFVPTFIFYKNGNEMGRIIETPEKTLESDLLNIVLK